MIILQDKTPDEFKVRANIHEALSLRLSLVSNTLLLNVCILLNLSIEFIVMIFYSFLVYVLVVEVAMFLAKMIHKGQIS